MWLLGFPLIGPRPHILGYLPLHYAFRLCLYVHLVSSSVTFVKNVIMWVVNVITEGRVCIVQCGLLFSVVGLPVYNLCNPENSVAGQFLGQL